MAASATYKGKEQSLPSPMHKQNKKLQGAASQRISTFFIAASPGKKKKTTGVFFTFLLSSDMSKLSLWPLDDSLFCVVIEKGFSNYTRCE